MCAGCEGIGRQVDDSNLASESVLETVIGSQAGALETAEGT